MLLIGLTGGIGSGKSTVSAKLAARGAVVIDADSIARQVVEPGRQAHAAVVARFGPDVVLPDGAIDRPRLAEVVFNDPKALADLEAITHPAIREEMARRMAELASTDRVVVLDVPLLVESGRSGTAGVIVVDCPEELAVRRLVESRDMTEDDARRRMAHQASREERRAQADVVVDNSGSLDDLDREVDRAWAWIEGLQARPHTTRR